MLRSEVVKSYNSESLDDILVALQKNGCSISEVRSVEINTSPNNLSLKCNGFLILFDDPYVGETASASDEETGEEDEPDDEDLTNEEKFFQDFGRRPFCKDRVDYLCPAEIAPLWSLSYDEFISKGCIGLDLDLDDPKRCNKCKKRFWKSKYKKPEKKEV